MAEELSSELEGGIASFRGWWRRRMEKADQETKRNRRPLYHYTNAAGLLGILQHEQVWLTSIFHMNDPSELAYGIELALDELRKEAKARNNRFVTAMAQNLEHVLVHRIGEAFGFFVASFSFKQDDLGQWRAYGDNGFGFALGMSARLFHPVEKASAAPNEKTFVARVVYGEPKIRRRQREVIRKAFDALIGCQGLMNAHTGPRFLESLATELSVGLLWNSLTSKHLAYSHEEEVRLIIVNGVHVLRTFIDTRTRGPSLVPFVRVPMPVRQRGSIAKIMIGPSAAVEAEDATHKLFGRFGIRSTGLVQKSDIPYRPT